MVRKAYHILLNSGNMSQNTGKVYIRFPSSVIDMNNYSITLLLSILSTYMYMYSDFNYKF